MEYLSTCYFTTQNALHSVTKHCEMDYDHGLLYISPIQEGFQWE